MPSFFDFGEYNVLDGWMDLLRLSTDDRDQTASTSDFVILLDNAGLALHGRDQAEVIRFINERLATAAQAIYTTHSPFMVETDQIESGY